MSNDITSYDIIWPVKRISLEEARRLWPDPNETDTTSDRDPVATDPIADA